VLGEELTKIGHVQTGGLSRYSHMMTGRLPNR